MMAGGGGTAAAAVLRATADNWFYGTGLWTATGVAPNDYKLHDTLAYLQLTTSETAITVEAVPFVVAGSAPSSVGIYVNGVYNQTLLFNGAAGVKASLPATLPAGPKTVKLIELGVGITGVTSVVAPTIPSAPAKSLVVIGDSISVGYIPAGTGNIFLGWPNLFREAGVYDRVTDFARASDLLANHYGPYGGEGFATFAARIVARCTGTVKKAVYCNFGVTDYVGPPVLPMVANYQTFLASLYDEIHALDASIVIYAQTITTTTVEGVANSDGKTPADFRAAKTTVAGARASYVTVVDGTTILSLANLQDSVHPNVTGAAQIAAALVPIVV